MSDTNLEQYLCQPIEVPLTDDVAKVDLIRTKDHPVMSFFYESCFYRKNYVICDTEYALPYDELFCFMNTTGDDRMLGAKLRITINGEVFETDRNCMIEIPAFLPHGPIELTDVETPVFSFVTGQGREHTSLPVQSWVRDIDVPIEKMVVYFNGDDGIVDEYAAIGNEIWLIRAIPGKTIRGSQIGSIRRFDETEGWIYMESAHMHTTPEILAYYGMDPWHPYELGGEYTMYLNGREMKFNKPTAVFIPPYIPHCPIRVDRVEKNNYWHSTGLSSGPVNAKPGFDMGDMPYINIYDGEVEMKEPW